MRGSPSSTGRLRKISPYSWYAASRMTLSSSTPPMISSRAPSKRKVKCRVDSTTKSFSSDAMARARSRRPAMRSREASSTANSSARS